MPRSLPLRTRAPRPTADVGEVGLDFPREWIEFTDPDDAEHLVRADVTWLCSRWTCIFGRGCHGIVADRPDDGCCSHGAFFTDGPDERRTRKYAAMLTPAQWQNHPLSQQRALKTLMSVKDSVGEQDNRRRTRTVDGVCLFANRAGFPGGQGCALHILADQLGISPVQTKPEVCWQLPVRREQEWVDRPDGTKVLISTLTEYDRRGWGEGGHDLHWYCTGSPEAHVGASAVYTRYGDELTELIGEGAYGELCRLLDLRVQRGLVAPHPADPSP